MRITVLENQREVLEKSLLDHIDDVLISLPNQFVKDSAGLENSITSLSTGKRLGLYIPAHGCEMCVNEAIQSLQKMDKALYNFNSPFILVNDNDKNLREIKILSIQTSLPVYGIDMNIKNSLAHLETLQKPFYFILDSQHSTFQSIFFPEEEINMLLREKYFKRIHHLFFQK